MIAAGGTGGHVFPGLALAAALVNQAGVRPTFVGTRRGLEASLVPSHGYAIETLDVEPMRGGGVVQGARGAYAAARAIGQALEIVRRTSPCVVVSIGGYAAGPVALAATMLGVPLALVEPNSIMGLSNRLLAPLARRIYLAFDQARTALSAAQTRLSGVPLREGFRPRARRPSAERRVLVLGGSLGAKALNERLPDALARARADLGGADLVVVHQTGPGRDAAVREEYSRMGLAARVVPFSNDLADDLAWADLVVARAGAGTIAEIAAVGRAALLVPYPHAADDHQAKNAAAYAVTGSAVWLRQADADSKHLSAELVRILSDDVVRDRLAVSARAQGRPEAARTIAADLLELAEVR